MSPPPHEAADNSATTAPTGIHYVRLQRNPVFERYVVPHVPHHSRPTSQEVEPAPPDVCMPHRAVNKTEVTITPACPAAMFLHRSRGKNPDGLPTASRVAVWSTSCQTSQYCVVLPSQPGMAGGEAQRAEIDKRLDRGLGERFCLAQSTGQRRDSPKTDRAEAAASDVANQTIEARTINSGFCSAGVHPAE